DARIQQWIQFASPKRPSDQIAALVGVTPAAVDPGQPVELALNKSETRMAQVAPAPAPAFASVPAPAPAPVAAPQIAEAAPAPRPEQQITRVAPAPAPSPAAPAANRVPHLPAVSVAEAATA